ncbi:MAG: hypothetical protein AAB316_18695, partial [Bacteroidota bacterium]
MRLIAFFTLLLAALAPAMIAFGQNYWSPLAGPYGIPLAEMAVTDNGLVYLFTQNKGVLRSDNDGESWLPLNDGLPQFAYPYVTYVATAPGGKVYISDGTTMYRLSSSGNSWQNISLNFPDYPDQIFTNPQGHLFVTAYGFPGAVFRSTNQGSTYTTWLPEGSLEGFYFDFAFLGSGKNFAFATDFWEWKLYKISDNGSQVTPLTQGLSEMYELMYHPSGNLFLGGDLLLRSSDEGSSWDTLEILPGSTSAGVFTLDLHPSGDIYAQTGAGVFISKDLGDTWSPSSLPVTDYNYSWQFAMNQNALFAADTYCQSNLLLRSSDNGESWEHLEDEFFVPNIHSIFKDPFGNLYASDCTAGHMLRSPDEGYSWEPFLLPNGSNVLILEKNSLGYLFAVAEEADSLFRSTDGGVAWENITPPGLSNILWLDANPQDELYLQAEAFFAKSADHGETWTPASAPPFSGEAKYAFHPDGSLYAWSVFSSGIWRSQNGQGWTHLLESGDMVVGFHSSSTGDIFFSKYNSWQQEEGLYRSTDQMATYELIYESTPVHIFSDLEGDVFIRTNDGIEYSEDDGATWQTLNQGLPDDLQPNTFYISDDQYIYAGFTGDVIYKTALPVAHQNLVKGNIWYDENENCQQDPGEPPLPGWLVKSVSGGDQFVRSAGFDGSFIMSLPTGNHVLNPLLPNDLWENSCASQGVPVSFSGSGDTAFVDFPISAAQLCPMLEVDLSTALLRRCFENSYIVKVCNRGTAEAQNAQVDVTLDSFFIYQSATLPLLAQNGNTYTFAVGDLNVLECRTFKVFVTVSCDASLGQEHCMSAWLDQDPTCPNLPAAAARECQPNIGSFDPNDKMALVNGSPTTDWVHPNTDLEFHIRFQNTGTDTAFNVVVEDQLSSWLDPATIQPGASSHPYFFEMNETGRLLFHFNAI